MEGEEGDEEEGGEGGEGGMGSSEEESSEDESSEEESRHVGDWLRGSNAAMGQDFWAKIMREKRVAEAKKARNKLNGCRQPLSSSDPLLRAAHSGDESKIRELLDFVKEK